MRKCSRNLTKTLSAVLSAGTGGRGEGSERNGVIGGSGGAVSSGNGSGNGGAEEVIKKVSVRCSQGEIITVGGNKSLPAKDGHTKGGNINGIAVGGRSQWQCPITSEGDGNTSGGYVEIALPTRRNVTGISIQGGNVNPAAAIVSNNDNNHSNNQSNAVATTTTVPSSSAAAGGATPTSTTTSPSEVTLACGVTLANCAGDVALTSAALGEVIIIVPPAHNF